MGSSRKFEKDIEWDKKHIPEFSVTYFGSAATIEIYGYKFIYFGDGTRESYLPGIFLGRNLHKDLEKYILKHGLPENYSKDIVVKAASPKNLKRFEEEVLCAYDISHCYWRTAYLMKFITEKTYLKGLEKPEYKDALHVIIGALGRHVITEYYKDGMKISVPDFKNYIYQPFFYLIKDYVFKLFVAVKKEFPEDLCMWKTDCFYFNPAKTNEIVFFIESFGYTLKYDSIMVKKVTELKVEYFCVNDSVDKEMVFGIDTF